MKNNYKIAHQGLKEGTHQFSFTIDNTFFEYYTYPEILGGKIEISLVLDKKIRHMELDFDFSGTIKVNCDLCLEPMNLPLDIQDKLFIKPGEGESKDSDVMLISPNANEIDLSQYLFDTISVSMPYKKVHEKDKNGNYLCNPDMLNKLKEYSNNENKNKPVDSRWDKLKNINFN